MVGGLSSVGGFSVTSFRSPPPAASSSAPAVRSPASAVPSQNPSLRALLGESGFDGAAKGQDPVGIPVLGGSLNDIFLRKVNAIRTGNILGLLF